MANIRFKAYKLYKGKEALPGLLTVVAGRLLPEFAYGEDFDGLPISRRYSASSYGWHSDSLELYDAETPANVASWVKHKGCTHARKVIVER